MQLKPLLDVWPRIELLLRILLIISSLNFEGKMAYWFSAASDLIFCNCYREETSLYETITNVEMGKLGNLGKLLVLSLLTYQNQK